MPEERVFIRTADMGAGLTLEGILYLPAGGGPFPAVAVCHPHPLYGGTMFNNVVYAICDGLAEQRIASLRFNFRGAGNSEGQHGGGTEEVFDAQGALNFLEANPAVDRDRLGLAGYSFGARVAVHTADRDPRVRALAAISLPTRDLAGSGTLAHSTFPKLFVVGDQDHIVAGGELQRFVEGLPEPAELHLAPGADHFWGGYEGLLAPLVGGFFARALGAAVAGD